ncbi:hypothetical protein WSM22_03580 [Cytophagales bacterium WSM2-2]|nr:hypothetical protein WSM22_03580 [Cytophagales bacterium WSM2-2]
MSKIPAYPLKENLEKINKLLEDDKKIDMYSVNLELMNISEYIVRLGVSEIKPADMKMLFNGLEIIEFKFKRLRVHSYNVEGIRDLLIPG